MHILDHTMSADEVPTKTALTVDVIENMRTVLSLAIECFASERDSIDAECFKPNENGEVPDFSIAVNKTNYITDNCATLCENEMALFIQMKRVDCDLAYIAAIIFSTTGDRTMPVVARLAEDYKPRWEGTVQGDPNDVTKLTDLLIDCVEDACDNAHELFSASEMLKKDV